MSFDLHNVSQHYDYDDAGPATGRTFGMNRPASLFQRMEQSGFMTGLSKAAEALANDIRKDIPGGQASKVGPSVSAALRSSASTPSLGSSSEKKSRPLYVDSSVTALHRVCVRF